MSEFFMDLSGYVTTGLESAATKVAKHSTNDRAGKQLEMTDFLQLMVKSFQNQTIDDTASISDMMNQMMQMSVIQAVTSISSLITDSTNLSYAASLVGKEVTVGQQAGRTMEPIHGVVTGTGVVDGKQVIFMGDKSYWMTDIMAVGRLPNESASLQSATEESDELGAANVTGEEDKSDILETAEKQTEQEEEVASLEETPVEDLDTSGNVPLDVAWSMIASADEEI